MINRQNQCIFWLFININSPLFCCKHFTSAIKWVTFDSPLLTLNSLFHIFCTIHSFASAAAQIRWDTQSLNEAVRGITFPAVACNGTNWMHNLSSVYSVTIPLHVLGLQVAHHQEVTKYICNKWYVLYVLVVCQLAWLWWDHLKFLLSPKHVEV
jgi:hypothetical protein